MTTYILDASAILRFTDRAPGHQRVRDLINLAIRREARLLISAVNWGEVVCVIYRQQGMQQARQLITNLLSLPWVVVDVSAEDAEAAGLFKEDHKVPYADAFAGALTLQHSIGLPDPPATLVTSDNDFRGVRVGLIKIEFLS